MGRPPASEIDTATPERLIEAAIVEFANAGFDGARLEDIAERAGIRRSSLLYHFDTKEALYAAVVHRSFAQIGAALLAGLSQTGPFGDRLANTAESFARFIDKHPALARLIVREILDRRGPVREMLKTVVLPLLDQIEEFVRREGKGDLPTDFPVRQALMQICSNILLRAVAGSLGDRLWTKEEHFGELARYLFASG